MRDQRDPEQVGQMLIQLKEIYPDKAAPERADLLEEWFSKNLTIPSTNGK